MTDCPYFMTWPNEYFFYVHGNWEDEHINFRRKVRRKEGGGVGRDEEEGSQYTQSTTIVVIFCKENPILFKLKYLSSVKKWYDASFLAQGSIQGSIQRGVFILNTIFKRYLTPTD